MLHKSILFINNYHSKFIDHNWVLLMIDKKSNSQNKTLIQIIKALFFSLLYMITSVVLFYLLLQGTFRLLGYQPRFYIDGRYFETVEQTISKGSVTLTSNNPSELQIIEDYDVSLQSPNYLQINDTFLVNDDNEDNHIQNVFLKISGGGWLSIGACNESKTWITPNYNDWTMKTSVSDQDLECSFSKVEEKGYNNVQIRSQVLTNYYEFYTKIQQNENVYTALRSGESAYNGSLKCEIWINQLSDEPDYVFEDVDIIYFKSVYPTHLSGKTNMLCLDDDDVTFANEYDLFFDLNYYDINVTNISNVKLQQFDGNLYQYYGDNLVDYKSFREDIVASGYLNTAWKLKNGESRIEVSGIPEKVTKSGMSIKTRYWSWAKINALTISLTIFGAVLGGLNFFVTYISRRKETN